MTFAEALKVAIERSGWNQTRLGIEVGLHSAMISYLVNGKRGPSLFTAEKLARALGLEFRDGTWAADEENAKRIRIETLKRELAILEGKS